MMKSNRLFLAGGILAGAAAGVLVGILLAPDKGSDTRRKIFEKGEDYLDEFNDKLEGLLHEVKEKVKSAAACHCGPGCHCKEHESGATGKGGSVQPS